MAPNKWKSSSGSQANQILRIGSYQDALSWWPFFLEGMDNLTDPKGANMSFLTPDLLFKTLLELAVYPDRGFAGVLVNKNSVPLGFILAHDSTTSFRPRELTLFAIFTNHKCPSTTRELMYELKNWGRREGFQSLRATMPKRSGAAVRFFTRVLGLAHTGMSFSVDL